MYRSETVVTGCQRSKLACWLWGDRRLRDRSLEMITMKGGDGSNDDRSMPNTNDNCRSIDLWSLLTFY
ncbi:hypothetical protein [Candidatus Hodgkinia cicadicola]|uniref:hypothetical protein n=1 Tax=Candidatus Hodgkinia cicadicola TaxID=573658 RepID=UPI0011BA6E65